MSDDHPSISTSRRNVITINDRDDVSQLLNPKPGTKSPDKVILGPMLSDAPHAKQWTNAINKGLSACGCATGMVALIVAGIVAWWIAGNLLAYRWPGQLTLTTVAGITGLLIGKFSELWYRKKQMEKALNEIRSFTA